MESEEPRLPAVRCIAWLGDWRGLHVPSVVVPRRADTLECAASHRGVHIEPPLSLHHLCVGEIGVLDGANGQHAIIVVARFYQRLVIIDVKMTVEKHNSEPAKCIVLQENLANFAD